MSETVHYRGKLVEIEATDTHTVNSRARLLCESFDIKEDVFWKKYYDGDYVNLLCNEKYDEYVCANNRLFKIESKESIDLEEEIIDVFDNEDGTFNYEVKYYNGGAGFEEVIEQAFNKLKIINEGKI